jgi:eukaryotic-like serine/threonine-protein kinase
VPKVRQERSRSERMGNRLVAVLVVLGVLLVATGLGLQRLAAQSVTMPRVVGEQQGLAKLQLHRRLLRVDVGTPRPSADVPAGRVAAQSVPPDRAVRRFTVIVLFPSSGIVLPNLAGVDAGVAQARLDQLRLAYTVDQQPSLTVPAGQVVGTNPPPGTPISDQEVRLTVSSGRPRVDVPAVDGLSFTQARRRLNAAKLKVNRENVFADGVRPGFVVRTNPPSGTNVEQGSTVQVQVSKGADEVVVPSVRGMDANDAADLLRKLGLEPRRAFFGARVLDQNPAPGRKVRHGTTVVLFLSPV